MYAIENFISYEVIQKIGWVLLHFTWQAAAVTFVLAFALRIMRKFSANTRYIAACFALLIVVALPFITAQFIEVSAPPAAPAIADVTIPAIEPATTPIEVTFDVPSEKPAKVVYLEPVTVIAKPYISWKERIVTFIEPKLSAIVTIWLFGVFALAIWHLGGYAQLQKLRRKMVKQVESSLNDKLHVLAKKLGVNQAVQLLESALVQVPTVVGWLKPIILLPASALTGLSTGQLEAILAHELAHIKRYDYLVNILQTIVEILGFYHPAVWWISHKIRHERENCCDDLAVAICGDKIHYAKALASMEEIRGRDQLAVAATGGNLFSRICRLLGKDSSEKNALSWIPALTVILLLIVLAIPTTIAFTSSRNEIDSDLSAEDILKKVRQAQRPYDNMQIEWDSVSETSLLPGIIAGIGKANDDMLISTKSKWSASLSGNRSRLQNIQESYYARDINNPGNIRYVTLAYDGVTGRTLTKNPKRITGSIRLNTGPPHLLQQELFGNTDPLIYNEENIKGYFYTVKEGNEPNILILDCIEKNQWIHRLTIDKSKSYNIIKYECIRSDGTTDYEDIIKLKQYPNGLWFFSERERYRYHYEAFPKEEIFIEGDAEFKKYAEKLRLENDNILEHKVIVTDVKFGGNISDDTFSINFPEGTNFIIEPFDYGIGNNPSVREVKSEEDQDIKAILDKSSVNGDEVFGPVIERTIHSLTQSKNCFIDFDTGNVFDVPKDFLRDSEHGDWFEQNGIDTAIETDIDYGKDKDIDLCGLATLHCMVIPISNERWDNVAAKACNEAFEKMPLGQTPLMSAEGQLPATYLFQTLDNRGILQILESKKDSGSHSIKVRYKLIQNKEENKSDVQSNNTDTNTKVLIEAQVIHANEDFLLQAGLDTNPNNHSTLILDSTNKNALLRNIDKSKNASYASHLFMMSTSGQEVTIKSGSGDKINSNDLGRIIKVRPELSQDGLNLNLNTENVLLSDDNTLLILGDKPVSSQNENNNEIILIKATVIPDEQGDSDDSKVLSDSVFTSLTFQVNFNLNLLEPGQYIEIKKSYGKREVVMVQINEKSIGKTKDDFPAYAGYADFDIRSNFDFNLATKRYTKGILLEHDNWDASFTNPNAIIGNDNFSNKILRITAWKANIYAVTPNSTFENKVEVQIKPAKSENQFETQLKNDNPELNDNLEILDIDFKPVHSGTNEVYFKIRNKTDEEQIFVSDFIVTSPDENGENSIGNVLQNKFTVIEPQKTETIRAVYRFARPFNEHSYLQLILLNPPKFDEQYGQYYFFFRKFDSNDLKPSAAKAIETSPANQTQVLEINRAFRKFQNLLQNQEYDKAWELLTDDYKIVEFHSSREMGLEAFNKAMKQIDEFYLSKWDKKELLKLLPGKVSYNNDTLYLAADYEELQWTIHFKMEDGQYKINWIEGYTPGFLKKEQEKKSDRRTVKKLSSAYKSFLNLDKSENPSLSSFKDVSIILKLTEDERIFYDDMEIEISEIRPLIKKRLEEKELPVVIEATENIKSGLLIRVIDEANLAGAKEVNVASRKQIENQTDDKSKDNKKQVLIEMSLLEVNERYFKEESIQKELLKNSGTVTAVESELPNMDNIPVDVRSTLQNPNPWPITFLDDSQIDSIFYKKNENITIQSHPAILVFENQPATIKSITEHPYVSGYTEPNNPNEIATPIVEFLETGFTGTCTPHVTHDNQYIVTELSLEHSEIYRYEEHILNNKSKGKVPSIARRTMGFTITTKPDQTLVVDLGEVKTEQENKSDSNEDKKELLFLIKATNISSEQTKTQSDIENNDENDIIKPFLNEYIINTSKNAQRVEEQEKSEEIPDSNMIQRIYDIIDLVYMPSMGGMMTGGYGTGMRSGYGGSSYGGYNYGSGGSYGGYGGVGYGGYGGGYGIGPMGGYDSGVMTNNRAHELKNLIMQIIEPDSWNENNDKAKGMIEVFPVDNPKKMEVTNTIAVHEQIEQLLESLRESLGRQVSLEVRYILGSEQDIKEILESTDIKFSLDTSLDDIQVTYLIRASQKNKEIKSIATPRATVLDGETALFVSYEQESTLGIIPCRITPLIAHDKNSVIINIEHDITDIKERTVNVYNQDIKEQSATTFLTKRVVPNGKTLAFLGSVNNQQNSATDKKSLITLIKPTMILQEQTETRSVSPDESVINTYQNEQPVNEQKVSEEKPDHKMVQRTYDISDIVYDIARKSKVKVSNYTFDPMSASGGISSQTLVEAAVQLVKQIMNSIEPDSWYEKNKQAQGTLYPYPAQSPKKITITNTPEVHIQIEKYLEAIRNSIDMSQVFIEMRYISGSEQAINEILNTIGIVNFGSNFLDDTQVAKLLKDIQGIQNLQNIIMPNTTVLNGETAIFENMRQQPALPDQINLFFKITPRISQNKDIVFIEFDDKKPLEWNDSNQPPNFHGTGLVTRLMMLNGKTCAFSMSGNSTKDKKSLILIKPTIILQNKELPAEQEGFDSMIEEYSEVSPRRIPDKSLNSQQIYPNPVLIETQILQVSDTFLKQIGLDAKSLKESDTWSRYSIDNSNEPNVFVIDELSANLLQQTIDASKGITVKAKPVIIAATGKEAEMLFLTETYYVHKGPLTKSELKIEKSGPYSKEEMEIVSVGPSINFLPEIVNQNNIMLKSEFNILENIPYSTILKINDKQVMEGSMSFPKYVTLYGESIETIIPDGQTLLIIGNKISTSTEKKKSKPLINLPLIDGLFKVKNSYKINDDYIQLFLIKPTILSPEKAKKMRIEL